MQGNGRISWADLASDESEGALSPMTSPEQFRKRVNAGSVLALSGDHDSRQNVVNSLVQKLDELYEKRDRLLDTDSIQHNVQLLSAQTEILEALEKLGTGGTPQERAQLHYIRGKAFDMDTDYVPKAEDELSRAVKLDVSLGDAWNQLGMSFWKKGEVHTAHDCWQSTLLHCSALPHVKTAMQHLSMAYRAKGSDPAESLRIAKDLISKDMNDGKSWCNLGNAYMSFFFASSLDREDLFRALKAYNRSEACGERQDPDLHYNRATVHRYLEDYQSAISELRRAAQLDPQLQAAPAIQEMEELVQEMSGMMARRCNLKPERLTAMLSALPPDKVAFASAEYAAVTASELTEGVNDGVAVSGLLLASPNTDGPIRHLVVAERGGELLAVSVYNMRNSKLKPGDIVCALSPFLRICTLPDAPDTSYRCLQVCPGSLLHQGRACDTSYYLRPPAVALAPLPRTPQQPHTAQ